MLLKIRASGVLAQTVDVTPDASGMPGGALIQQLLNWSQMLALWGSLGAILIGAAMYGLAQQGNSYAGASRGKTLAMGGVVGAILAGLARAVPGAVPFLGAEADRQADGRLIQLGRLTNLALALTLTIAGCSLAVAVAAGIIERKRPLALLRVAGMHLSELQQTALLEAAAPLLFIALASAMLGLGTSAAVVGLAGGIPWKMPTLGYWLSLIGGLVVALGVVAAALPLLGRTSAPSAVRFE